MAEGGKSSSGAIEVSKNAADGAVGGSPHEWEILAMTKSVADLKGDNFGLGNEAAPPSEDSGVADAAMHSQYFGKEGEIVIPMPPASDEPVPGNIFPQAASDGTFPSGGLSQTENAPFSGQFPEPEQDVSEPDHGISEPEQEPLIFEKFRGPEFGEEEKKEMPKPKVSNPAPPRSSCEVSAKGWVAKHLNSLRKHITVTSALCSVAIVAVVTGLVIIGRRWRLEHLKNMQLELQNSINDEKINELAAGISEVVEPPPPTTTPVVEPTPEAVPASRSWIDSHFPF